MASRGTVLISGASRGLGRSVAGELARRGFTVLAGVRREEDANAVLKGADGDLRPLILDVTSSTSIASAETEVRKATAEHGLAGLVNNAAVFLLGPFEQTPLPTAQAVFDVNLMGVIALTQAFLPLLRVGRGRIVNISSVNGRLSFPFSSFYSASKYALEGLSDALRVELQPWGIEVIVVEPGVTRTDIRAEGARGWTTLRDSLSAAERALYETPYNALQQILPGIDADAADHTHMVEAVHSALTASTPDTRYLAGPDTVALMEMAALPDRDRDAAFGAMFGTV